jgi:hypothetical protein
MPHDVQPLAARAGIETTDDAERAPLTVVREYILTIGRYPSSKQAAHFRSGYWADPPVLVAACRRLLMRAAEGTARVQRAKDKPIVIVIDGRTELSEEQHVAFTVHRVEEWLDGSL